MSTAPCILLYSSVSTYVGLYGSSLFNFGSYVSLLTLFACFLGFSIPTSSFILLKMFFIINNNNNMNRYVCIKTYLYILPEISAHHLQLKCMGGHLPYSLSVSDEDFGSFATPRFSTYQHHLDGQRLSSLAI